MQSESTNQGCVPPLSLAHFLLYFYTEENFFDTSFFFSSFDPLMHKS